MSDTTHAPRTWAVDAPKNGAKLFSIAYDPQNDVATVCYDNGDKVVFPDCSKAQYGFGMIAERNPDGTLGQLYTLMDDETLHLIASMTLGERRGIVSEDDIKSDAADAVLSEMRDQFRKIGIPATFRRLGMHVMTHLETIKDLEETLPFQLSDAVVAKYEVGDAAFRRSRYLD